MTQPYKLFPAEVCERISRDGGSVFPAHAGSKSENLIPSKCFPLFSQQRTFGSQFGDPLAGY
jgi:hypothetical protein